MTYLGWYDPDKKRTTEQKITAACERFREKFGDQPDTVLISPADADRAEPINGLTIEVRRYIAMNTFYVGRQGGTEPAEMAS